MTRRPRSIGIILHVVIAVLYATGHARAQGQGISDERILFGQSAAFSGPARNLGTEMRIGIEAAFREINTRGGVHGRRLELVSLDDAYEPEAAIANTRQLIEQEKVFALIGAVGTPTSRSAVPVAAEAGVPYVAPFTGAAFLRDPKWRNVINLRASYYQETEEIVEYLTRDLGIDRIGVFYQDDSFGQAGYRGVRLALKRRNLEAVATGVYPRNTTAVKTGLLDLRAAAPEAVVLVGAYRPVAAFIAWAKHIDFEPVFVTISFVGSNTLIRELGPAGTGVFVTQVVPVPLMDPPALSPGGSVTDTTGRMEVITSYRQALATHDSDASPGFVSFEGYLAGRLVIHLLDWCGPRPERACFLDNMKRTEVIDIDGFTLRYGDDNQGSDAVFLTVVDADGRYQPLRTTGNRTDP